MRFSQLSLERYGRFENCTLDFRSGAPDLHVIYGANEAGKSTTLSAVSDLLFGFPARSPYNYRFDYPLLRIGAVLEADGQSFTCRRRKAADAQSLVDGQDRVIDAGPLRAMLHGQDRERFRLGFSLDQARLREGGRAMVEAKDDLGQALFAAGSGMTGVASTLAALETEADAIWGRRAAARRSYTVAERQYEDAQHRLRDLQLKPKAWTDARNALDLLGQALADREAERAVLTAERRRVERLRRTGPDLRRRAELLARLAEGPNQVRLSASAESLMEAALADLALAERNRAAALALLTEMDARLQAQAPDGAALEAADAIEALAERRGAELKATSDLLRLHAELGEKQAREARLQDEIGRSAPMVSRLTVARLRELAGQIAQANAALATLRVSTMEAGQRAAPLRLALADAEVAEGLSALVVAVDAARALGADVDARCAAQATALQRLETQAGAALARLAPWAGQATDLAALPTLGPAEIDAVQAVLSQARDTAQAQRATASRAEAEIEALDLKRRELAEGGQAIPAAHIEATRQVRRQSWTGLREHLLGGAPLADSAVAVAAFETATAQADAAADQRFALAESSGRLAALDLQAMEQALVKAQARARADQAVAEGDAAMRAWTERLTACGLPPLEPARLRTWLDMRREALAADDAVRLAREGLDADLTRRAQASARLAALIPSATAPDGLLAPLLERAGALRRQGEARTQQVLTDRAELRSLEDQLATQARQTTRLEAERGAWLDAWAQACASSDLQLQVEGAEAWFQILDELRIVSEEAAKLAARIGGIERDSAAFAAAVAALADALGEPAQGDPSQRLDALRRRLAGARSSADARKEIEATRQSRLEALGVAEAARDAALASLTPRLAELGVIDVQALPIALDASRQARLMHEALAQTEQQINAAADGYAPDALAAAFAAEEPDTLAARMDALDQQIAALDIRITEAADAVGAARRTFQSLEAASGAPEAAADMALARAEMDAQAESYLLKRAQAVTLRWAVERYRERRQSPLLARASELFSTLTLGRYAELKIDLETTQPRLLGLREDRASLVEVDHMSEGTTDQLFLALRLAAVEQAIAAGVRLPFLADDLFVNFDDARSLAGLKVLGELARSTQVLIFTHHAHLSSIAREALGADTLSECELS